MKTYTAALATLVTLTTAGMCSAQREPQNRATAAPPDCGGVAAADHSNMNHEAHLAALERCAGSLPASSGQAAFGAMSEVVRLLKADPKTDWSKVNIEALRQHLIDMDEVTMRSVVLQRNVPNGIEADVTGAGRTSEAIRRMARNHSAMLGKDSEYNAVATEIPGGARLRVTAKNSADPNLVARIRGLGFAGIMTEGDHHAAHHIAIARGELVHAEPHTPE